MPFIKVGQIVTTFGLKGQVKVDPLTDFLSRFEKGQRLRLKGEWVEVEKATFQNNRLLLKLSGVNDVDAARALKWEYLEAVDDGPPVLEEGEFLVASLIGMRVVTTEGKDIGVVDQVLSYPAQDVLQIGETLIPMVKQFVKNVDEVGKTITVELIPGMLPE